MSNLNYISIGIPFYNAEKYLEDAICSVLAQTHKYWELILIDDGSSDSSLSIANNYAKLDSRIRVISDGKNEKLPFRLNQIIHESRYDFIARMDADDLMSNDRLKIQLQTLIDNIDVDIVTTGYLTIGKQNELTGVSLGQNFRMKPQTILRGSTNLVHASLLARKSWYKRNLYNESNLLAEDFELWLIAAKNSDLKYTVLEETLYWYRVVENVKIEKLIQAYNSQIKTIKENYKGIISKTEKNKIVVVFQAKKAIAKTLSRLCLLELLLNRRSNNFSSNDIEYYEKNLSNIYHEKKD